MSVFRQPNTVSHVCWVYSISTCCHSPQETPCISQPVFNERIPPVWSHMITACLSECLLIDSNHFICLFVHSLSADTVYCGAYSSSDTVSSLPIHVPIVSTMQTQIWKLVSLSLASSQLLSNNGGLQSFRDQEGDRKKNELMEGTKYERG